MQHRTFKDYGDLLRRYVREPIGNIKLSDLKAVHIQKLYGEILGRGLSPRIVRYTHATLSSALKEAVKLDILPRNVATLVQLPKQNQKEMDVLSKDESIFFLQSIKGERHENHFFFALASGMRCKNILVCNGKTSTLKKARQPCNVQLFGIGRRRVAFFTTENSKITSNYSFAFINNARTSAASNQTKRGAS